MNYGLLGEFSFIVALCLDSKHIMKSPVHAMLY